MQKKVLSEVKGLFVSFSQNFGSRYKALFSAKVKLKYLQDCGGFRKKKKKKKKEATLSKIKSLLF